MITFDIEVKNGNKVIAKTLSPESMYIVRAIINSIRTNQDHNIKIIVHTSTASSRAKTTSKAQISGQFTANKRGFNYHVVHIYMVNCSYYAYSVNKPIGYAEAKKEYCQHVLAHELAHAKHWIEERYGMCTDKEKEVYADNLASKVTGVYKAQYRSYLDFYKG